MKEDKKTQQSYLISTKEARERERESSAHGALESLAPGPPAEVLISGHHRLE